MSNIFTGMLLIFLDFNLNLGSSTIELIPDFIGYMIMLKGLNELSIESKSFMKAIPYTSGMAIYAVILFVMDLIGFTSSLGGISLIFGAISTIMSLYISYEIIMGIKDIEIAKDCNLNSNSLYNTWKNLAIIHILTFVLLIIPVLAIIGIIIALIVTISYLVTFNNTKNLYYNLE